jgi:multiple sugar transport system permease protein
MSGQKKSIATGAPDQGRTAPALMRLTSRGGLYLLPYILLFVLFVVYPVFYGIRSASDQQVYVRLWRDPAYLMAVANTAILLVVIVNVKMALALCLSSFFVQQHRWIQFVSVLFLLPWAIPSLVSILSIRWMLNAEWGMVNNIWFAVTGDFGPYWLLNRWSALGSIAYVHIWKSLPFWTLVLVSARLTIPRDLYEAARVDGATPFQQFRLITVPSVRGVYITSSILSMVWTLGDFSTVYLLTGGGPGFQTEVLATLGIRYAFKMNDLQAGVATVITALPVLVPLTVILVRRIKREALS